MAAAARPRGRGFSLTELMIVLVVMGILAAIAYPSYRNYILESRRASAHSALFDAATRQEQYFLNNRTYTTTVGTGGLGAAATTEGGHYALAVDAPTGACPITQCFVLRATPQGAQANDTCGALTLGSDGNKAPAGCW